MHIIGIDIGGTKITVCIGDEKGSIVATKRFATEPSKGYKRAFNHILKTINELLAGQNLSLAKIKAIGISCPGPVDTKKGKLLTPPNLKGWENLAIVQFFKMKLKRPVYMNNDAKAAALATFHFGNSRAKNLIYLTASTGMGGGLIVNGQLLQGFTDTAGEVGHFIIVPNGRKCACGQKGCFEAYCGGKAFAAYVKERIKKEKPKTSLISETLDMKAFVNAVKEKDQFAQKMFKEFIERLAQGIGTLLMIFNPEVVVLGTIAIHAGNSLLMPLRKAIKAYAWLEPRRAKIIASKLKTDLSEKSALAVAIEGLKSHY